MMELMKRQVKKRVTETNFPAVATFWISKSRSLHSSLMQKQSVKSGNWLLHSLAETYFSEHPRVAPAIKE